MKIKVENAKGYRATDENGNDVTDKISFPTRKKAGEQGLFIEQKDGGNFRLTDKKVNEVSSVPSVPKIVEDKTSADRFQFHGMDFSTHADRCKFIADSPAIIPVEDIFVSDLLWRALIRNTISNTNIMLTGQAGCGKTQMIYAVAKALSRPLFYFNIGAMQDALTSLIGKTTLDVETGTVFAPSEFVKAITTDGAIILLDEISRANVDATNILMSVLDSKLRLLRLDDNNSVVKVADNVSFFATANIGKEYTATYVLDHALKDRFTPIEVERLSKEEEVKLIKMRYPHVKDEDMIALVEVVAILELETKQQIPQITHAPSTRHILEIAGYMNDGFSFLEACKIALVPSYSSEGGNSSEQAFILIALKKFVKNEKAVDELFKIKTDEGSSAKKK